VHIVNYLSGNNALPIATSSPVQQPRLTTTRVLGVDVVNASVAATLDWLCARLDAQWPARIAFLNAHCANVSACNTQYRDALGGADAVLPDGSGVSLALRMRGERLTANLNGTDLIPSLCQRLAARGQSVFLLGGRPGVADHAAARLQKDAPGLIIAGTQHGYFDAGMESRVIRDINASGAAVVLVAMGVPAQDEWLARNAARLRATLTFGVGGLFDFLSGRIPRAPRVLRRTGLEWTYRLYQEPKRMWRRYILGNPAFVARVIADAVPSMALVRERADLAAKRALDAAAAAAGVLLLAPLLLSVALAIRLTSKGPALLRQVRIGQDGAPFTLYKFRSMYHDAEARRAALLADNAHGANGVTFKMKHDPRITPVGRLLRRSSIDELPQLLNVLGGTMSLVGPRPPLPSEVARYTPRQRQRLCAKPGLTCLWQVSGRANLPFPRQVELDIEYMGRRSLWLDIAILFRTVPAVLLARGAY
jgi:exopolysaccharide biosynthesis WecB/TagA/CpsF family protein